MNQITYDLLVKPFIKFYKRRILKDPFQLAVKQWKRDRGDSTLRYDYELAADSLVVDVGGYHGDFAAEIVRRFGCRVAVFEPMPAFYDLCVTRFANDPRVSVYPFGLGSDDAVLELSDLDNGSSFHIKGNAAESVHAEIRDVARVWQELDFSIVSLMKVNIEGGEYPLIPRLIETGLISNVEHLQVQFHDFIDGATTQRASIRDHLAQTHQESWCYPFVWENWQIHGLTQAASLRAA
jgi:FkbM family methyltransferase